jgi:hypothetical protein
MLQLPAHAACKPHHLQRRDTRQQVYEGMHKGVGMRVSGDQKECFKGVHALHMQAITTSLRICKCTCVQVAGQGDVPAIHPASLQLVPAPLVPQVRQPKPRQLPKLLRLERGGP